MRDRKAYLAFLPLMLAGVLSSFSATVEFVQIATNDASGGGVIAAVSETNLLETPLTATTVSAPSSWSGYTFTHWTVSSDPGELFRDPWGRSENPVAFTILEHTTASAHYLPSAQDTNADGVPDWYKIEYYGSTNVAGSFDGDGDGFTLLQEFTNGTHTLYEDSSQTGGFTRAMSDPVVVNLADYARYTIRSDPEGTVDESAIVPPQTVITTPDMTELTFGYWTLDAVQQRDPWDIAVRQVSFTMSGTDREAVAYLFTDDSDTDGLPDAWELFYLGTLTQGATNDVSGDGYALSNNYAQSQVPNYEYETQLGGGSRTMSAPVVVNLAGFSSYTLRSEPAGTVSEFSLVPDGSTIYTPDMGQSTFGYWTLDGIQQRDTWGVALRQFNFVVNFTNREGVAYLYSQDGDADGINDGREYYYYNSLTNDANSDTDADGLILLDDTDPIYGNTTEDGGVSRDGFGSVLVNLQMYQREESLLVDGTFTNFFSFWSTNTTGVDFGLNSAPALGDWDGDGDLDLFVGSDPGRMSVYENVGSRTVPHLENRTSRFSALESAWTNQTRAYPTLGDWNHDDTADLVIGNDGTTLELLASSGNFDDPQLSTTNAVLDVGTTNNYPALVDINGDDYTDLLVLKSDGMVSVYTNTQNPSQPYSAPAWDTDLLGSIVVNPSGISACDVNSDGLVDILVSDVDGRIWEFRNNGSGYSLQSKVYAGSYNGLAHQLTITVADWDGDGDSDVVCGYDQGGLLHLRNPDTHLWVSPNLTTLEALDSQSFSVHGVAPAGVTWQLLQNQSGGSIDTNGVYTAGAFGGVDVVEASANGLTGLAYVNVKAVSSLSFKSVVITGRKSVHDTLWPVTDYLGDFAYNGMRYLGYPRDDLHYLSADPDQDVDGNGFMDDIDGLSAWTNVATLFTNSLNGTDDLFIYLVDHGSTNAAGEGIFHLRNGEELLASELDSWLDALQDTYDTEVTVVLDFCYAAAFGEMLDYTGPARRTIYAACDRDEATYFIAGGLVSFSDAFFSGLMLGLDFDASFQMAGDAIAYYQNSQSYGDSGIGVYPGDGSVMGRDVPVIGEICDSVGLNGTESVSLWADRVSGRYDISRVWCLVVPPDHTPDPVNPVMDVPEVNLIKSGAQRYERIYDGFSGDGLYKVIFYAQDIWGGVSLPRQMYVTQNGFDERALVILGPESNSVRAESGRYMAWKAWDTLQARRIPPGNITLLAGDGSVDLDGDSTPDATGPCTLAAVQNAFANEVAGSDKLTVCLIGGVSGDNFRLEDGTLKARDLDQLLDTYQSSNAAAVVVMEFAGSGDYVQHLVGPSSAERIVIASTQGSQSLWSALGRLSFSYAFWGHIFNGESIGRSFDAASTVIYKGSRLARQRSLLDDNGNGVANQSSDGTLAASRYIGSAFMTGGDAPVIGSVQDGETVFGTNTTVWVSNVTDMDGVSNVWCTISAPWYDGTTEPPQTSLYWNSASNRFESVVDGLSWTGAYVVTYFAEDVTGEIAAPVQGSFNVIQPDSDGDGIPDSWETKHFSGNTNAVATVDSDGDGYSNYQEWLAGTDPNNGGSVFTTSMLPTATTNAPTLQWVSQPNRIYSIWSTTNLLSPFELLADDLLASPDGTNTFTDPAGDTKVNAYYRLIIKE